MPLPGSLMPPGLWGAAKQYLRDAAPGGSLNPEVTPQGALDAAAVASMPVPVAGDLLGLASDTARMIGDPSERTLGNAALMAVGLLPLVPAAGVLGGKIRGTLLRRDASKSASIYNPKPLPQRPFEHDYPHEAAGSDDAGRITADIEGRPLAARYVAGRRVVGGADEAIDQAGIDVIGGLLGAPASRVKGSLIGGDAGQYVKSRTPSGEVSREIFINDALSPERAGRVQYHETGHLIDDLVQRAAGVGGSKIPTDGLSKELRRIYEDLNTAGNFKPGRGAAPKSFGYRPGEHDAELMAEAIRAYLSDPNYIKTVAPRTAARIREYVNANPNLKDVVQFNSLGAAALGGAIAGSQRNEVD